MKTLDFYFDFGSPAAYLAWTQVPRLCTDCGAALRYQPMLLGGVFQATGNHSPATIAAKGRYVFKDLARFARRYGVVLNSNPYFPINTLTLMRAAVGLQLYEPARFEAYLAVVFRAIWVESRNLNEAACVAQVWESGGFEPQALLALCSQTPVKDALKAATEQAVARGVFGAPTLFVGEQMFWGQDRLDFVREALLGS